MDLSAAIHLLGELLGQTLSEQESPALFETEERIRAFAKARRAAVETRQDASLQPAEAAARLAAEVAALQPDAARAVAAAFALYFDLVNLAEESNRVRALRQREGEGHPAPVAESIRETIAHLQSLGVTAGEIRALLDNLHIELVLTAHPTEAKRRTILSKLERISEALRALHATGLLPREREDLVASLHAEITALWLTDRARTARPAVTDEVRTGLYFVDNIFWEALPRVYADLDAALAEYYPGLKAPPRWLTLASWIGGDRDGNPNVTAAVTAETLRLHRGLAVEHHRRSLQDLARRLSLNARLVPLPPELQTWLEARRPLPAHAVYLESRYAAEPYRLIVSLLASDLETASRDDMTARLLETAPQAARAQAEDFTLPLRLISTPIPSSIAHYQLRPVLRQFDIFGLHAARLDIREDSSRLASALGEILRALNIELAFEQGDDRARLDVLIRLLSASEAGASRAYGRPHNLAPQPGVTVETAETWALFQLIARVRALYGRALLGPFIISMTRGPADVLTVLLLARWAGCDDGLQIAPLFETLDDLDAAPRILADLFTLDLYRAHLAACGDEQVVMIGYSDSNKDGGYLAANWALYQAQERIAQACRAHGVKLMLFHGRGGTVARGGGPANRAIRAQPPGTVNGRFRLTEQGEVVASRYADRALAQRHLEQIVSAVLLASVTDRAGEREGHGAGERESKGTGEKSELTPARQHASSAAFIAPAWREVIAAMSNIARRTYRGLVYETPGFMDYWRDATPLDEISRLRIGSRPATRRGGALNVAHIRAIPWVFSWMQARFNLPGWYGLGAALHATRSTQSGDTLLREMHADWPFFRALLDNAEMSLLKADLGIAALYSALVPDQDLADRIFVRLRDEYERTREAILAITGHTELMEADPVIQRSIYLRNPYVDPLNYLQIEMLRRLRALPNPDSPDAEALREVIVLTINGIAAGLRNTG
ncbi:MAG TPA: phosphoenolpyruvate carboxylase [Anaerolineales bacterium]|nr:phosphoenolpyruvate carboxylase [Anaerolineales bacterium]